VKDLEYPEKKLFPDPKEKIRLIFKNARGFFNKNKIF
jgi:hypothetical protein